MTAQFIEADPPEVKVKVSVPVLVTTTDVPHVFALTVNGCPAAVPQLFWTAWTCSTLEFVLVTAYGLMPENVVGLMLVSDMTLRTDAGAAMFGRIATPSGVLNPVKVTDAIVAPPTNSETVVPPEFET